MMPFAPIVVDYWEPRLRIRPYGQSSPSGSPPSPGGSSQQHTDSSNESVYLQMTFNNATVSGFIDVTDYYEVETVLESEVPDISYQSDAAVVEEAHVPEQAVASDASTLGESVADADEVEGERFTHPNETLYDEDALPMRDVLWSRFHADPSHSPFTHEQVVNNRLRFGTLMVPMSHAPTMVHQFRGDSVIVSNYVHNGTIFY